MRHLEPEPPSKRLNTSSELLLVVNRWAQASDCSTYRVELTKQPNYARATVHLLLDLVSLGIWELPGSIYELSSGHRKGDVGIVYGPDDRVLEVRDYQAIQAHPVRAGGPQTQQEQWEAFWNAVNK